MPEETTQNLYDSIFQKEMHHLTPEAVGKVDIKFETGGDQSVVIVDSGHGFPPVQADMTCTSTAVVYSDHDLDDKGNINNYVLLTHDIGFQPLTGQIGQLLGISEYRVRVKVLTNADSHRKAYFMKHKPGQTERLAHYSGSISHGVSVGVGYSPAGPDNMVVGPSSEVTKVVEMDEPSVRCDDHSTPQEIKHNFVITEKEARNTPHQFQIIHLACVPDEGLKEERGKDKADAQKLEFLLEFEAVVRTKNSLEDSGLLKGRKDHLTQVLSVYAPPRPKTD